MATTSALCLRLLSLTPVHTLSYYTKFPPLRCGCRHRGETGGDLLLAEPLWFLQWIGVVAARQGSQWVKLTINPVAGVKHEQGQLQEDGKYQLHQVAAKRDGRLLQSPETQRRESFSESSFQGTVVGERFQWTKAKTGGVRAVPE